MRCSTVRSGAHLQFYAFDILVDRGESTLRLPLEKRRERLAAALAKVEYPVIQSSPLDAKPAELVRAAQELGIEGLVAKRKGSLYEPGRRSGAWLKYKINQSPGVCHRRLYPRSLPSMRSSSASNDGSGLQVRGEGEGRLCRPHARRSPRADEAARDRDAARSSTCPRSAARPGRSPPRK